MHYNCLSLISLLSSIAAVATAQSVSATTTLPTLVLPSPTSIGNASNILTYPLCAQVCANETYSGCDRNTVDCACGATYRSETAACEKLTCNQADFDTTATLAQQLCGPFYANNSILSSSVAAAIATATSIAVAAVSGKNLTDPASLPQCAQNCFKQVTFLDCGSLANTTCICQGTGAFSKTVGACEIANCSMSDLEIVLDFADALCAPVNGFVNINATTTAPSTPTITPSEGAAASVALTGFNVFCVAFVGLMGAMGLLL